MNARCAATGRDREKKGVLRIIPRRSVCVQYLPYAARRGVDLFTEVVERNLEGIVARLEEAPYDLVDGRSPSVEIKNRQYTQSVGRYEQFAGFRARNGLPAGRETRIS